MEQKEQKDLFDKIRKICNPIILILTMLIWQAIGIVLLRVFGINYNNLSEILKVVCLFIFDLLFIVFLVYIFRKDLYKNFKDYFNKNIFKNIKISFDYWIVGLIIMVISNLVIAILTNGTLADNEESVRSLIDKVPLYMAFQVMVYAPLTEELIFRKSISDAIDNKILFIIISGLVFGGLHVISSVESLIDLVYLVPYCSLGFIFAALYRKTGNIFSTIIAHSFHNSLALIIYLLG